MQLSDKQIEEYETIHRTTVGPISRDQAASQAAALLRLARAASKPQGGVQKSENRARRP